MTAKRSTPRIPAGLGSAGKSLWKAILGDIAADWELDRRELRHLERACVVADRLAELDAAVEREGAMVKGSRGQPVVHPAVSEARQLELVQLRLLASLELEDPEHRRERGTPASKAARKAARSRWGDSRGSRAA
jgi:phage terminase small subunit